MLVQNEDTKPIEDLICVVPQQMFHEDGTNDRRTVYEDITADLINPSSPFSGGEIYEVIDGTPLRLRLTLPDPTDPTRDITYDGTYHGNNLVHSFSDSPEHKVIMNQRMFAAFRIRLVAPIQPDESRWLRLHLRCLTGPQENRAGFALAKAWLLNDLGMSFHVSGPTKVRYDIDKNLRVMRHGLVVGRNSDPKAGEVLADLDSLYTDLIQNGATHPSTAVQISDWRTRFFKHPMESFVVMQSEGAVRTVGAQPNYVKRQGHNAYYEWATGDLQVPVLPQNTEQGYFSIRFMTRYVPWLHKTTTLLAIGAIILSVVSIIVVMLSG